jgi:cytidyltransferase-like protein
MAFKSIKDLLMKRVVVSGTFDDLRSRHIRFLDEASRLGRLHLQLWSDLITETLGRDRNKFPQEERLYFLGAVRFVEQVTLVTTLPNPHIIPMVDELKPDIWVVRQSDNDPHKLAFCESHGIDYVVIPEERLAGYPEMPLEGLEDRPSQRKKVLVTGCYDWLHSGHVRFFEETAELGDLYVVVGHDENIRSLKGDGHPLFSQDERRYMVQAIRHVKAALISTGHGWMDAEPEIARIQPDLYVVNGDGDKPEKRAFCSQHRLDYVVLKRLPKEGLSRRESSALRGF